jgi:hypothetical protein
MNIEDYAGFLGVPVIVAIVQILKGVFPDVDGRYWPLFALPIAVIWTVGLALILKQPEALTALAISVVVWVTAMGAFSGGKALLGK